MLCIALILNIRKKIFSYFSEQTAYIDDNYVTLEPGTPRFKDLVFGLAYDEASVVGTYLGVYLKDKDETMIIICLVLTKDMDTMKNVYDQRELYFNYTIIY